MVIMAEAPDKLLFISHSRQNSGAALKLCLTLVSRGVRTWLDLREIDSGADWNEKVAQAIREANGFLFLIGPPGPNDQLQKFEWQQIAEQESYLDPSKPFIPVIIGQAQIPGFLRARLAIHVEGSDINFAVIADRVVNALSEPQSTLDPDNLQKGQAARRLALDNLRQYSRDLDEKALARRDF
jgi:hypothetical protein